MKVCLFSLLLWVGAAAFADDPPSPGVLYHWAKLKTLSRIAKMRRGEGGMPLDTIWSGQYLSLGYQELVNKPGLYTWSHPVTGMAADAKEIYGGEVLVKIKLKDGIRIKEVKTTGSQIQTDPIFEGAKTPQVLFHKHYDDQGKFQYSEYVILDPNCVETFSALPKASEAELLRELGNLNDPDHLYAEKDLHATAFKKEGNLQESVFNQADFKKKFAGYVRDFILLKKSRIPPRFRHVYGAPIEPCATAFTEIGEGG